MKMQITLGQQEVEKIVKEHLERKFKKVGEIHTDVSNELVGYGMGEREEACFNGMTCEVEVDI